jgi:hypothetical protein
LSFPADRADEIVEFLILSTDTSTTEPAGNSTASRGEDDSGHENCQSPGTALVKLAAMCYYQSLLFIWENPFSIHRLSFANIFCFANQNIGKDELFLFTNLYFKEPC